MKTLLNDAGMDTLLARVLPLLSRFRQNGDAERAEKGEKLVRKIAEKQFVLAFSGHFSAGKSSMINALTGDHVLPSSPIPTSANIVKLLQSDQEYAKVHFRSERPVLFSGDVSFEAVQHFCKDGEVTEIEIGRADSELPEGVIVMDTPGVDSTDDAHRLSTESALHLADAVFYVMDYNHVMSELNFTYTKNLLRHGVRLYLIINQIDKHRDSELSFDAFRESVKNSFAAWDVEPEGIFFTSLKKPDQPENQFAEVRALIEDAFSHREEWIVRTVGSACSLLETEHKEWLSAEKERQSEPYLQTLDEFPGQTADELLREESALKEEIAEKEGAIAVWEKGWNTEVDSLLKSAYLMPFETRELAASYLESMQPDFKAGWLFGRKKTEEERKTRLALFHEDVQKKTESGIDWHLRQLASKELKKAGSQDEAMQRKAQAITVDVPAELLQKTVKKGAGATGDAVLHYCSDVAAEIKKLAFAEMKKLKEEIIPDLQKRTDEALEETRGQLAKLKSGADAARELGRLNAVFAAMEGFPPLALEDEAKLIGDLAADWDAEKEELRLYDPASMPIQTDEAPAADPEIEAAQYAWAVTPETMVEKARNAAGLLQSENGFERLVRQLEAKADRVENRKFTIALFGAFSAGKSSFANALLGNTVLPVSPNPTTAAINRILPPADGHPHGTAAVKIKPESGMLADVNESLKMFGAHAASLAEASRLDLSKVSGSKTEGKENVHLAFLSAFQSGFDTYAPLLGDMVSTDLDGFRTYAADERSACFVESIDLYYDCPLTKRGITLVDTPGADSINARHTGVAFDYIKNADAILFVTYYNHAFSKADREFLIQLGRVKDAFELDKMFFLVNAVDLADSEEEKDEVIGYVRGQLTGYGIRFPRIYGVSSKLAVDPETTKESGMDVFQEAFDRFVDNDLTEMSVMALDADYKRIIRLLDELIEGANMDENVKEERKRAFLTARAATREAVRDASISLQTERLLQEAKELLFYVKQRVFLRFSDFFKEAFNPAVLQQKGALPEALEELLYSCGYDFAQEMRATAVRMEKYAGKLIKEKMERLQGELQTIEPSLAFSSVETRSAEVPGFEAAFTDADRSAFRKAFRHFRNPKAFFEGNEKKAMEEELKELLSPLADVYLEGAGRTIANHYEFYLDTEYEKAKADVLEDAEEQFSIRLNALEDTGQSGRWTEIRSALEQ